MSFRVLARDGLARRGRLETAHGTVETPAFMPVGTHAAVKGLPPWELAAAGADIMLANLYHLALRPGIEAIAELGGVHAFSGWRGPILTDSGGFQVFSLASRRRVDADGVTFRSHLDGDELRLTPRRVVEMQVAIGSDLAMVLDECPPWPIDRRRAAESAARTLEWARRSREVDRGGGSTALWGIVQGSVFGDLRERAAADLAALDFDGYAIGGVSVGEPAEERRRVVEVTAPRLPEDRPRYLMGVGTPGDLHHAVAQGVDLFDCVLPSRDARHGRIYTRAGTLQIKNAVHRADPRPLDPECPCRTCAATGRALLHHLVRAGHLTGMVLATVHNVRFFLDFMAELREGIESGTLADRASQRGGGESPQAGPANT